MCLVIRYFKEILYKITSIFDGIGSNIPSFEVNKHYIVRSNKRFWQSFCIITFPSPILTNYTIITDIKKRIFGLQCKHYNLSLPLVTE